jgi:hypothetical protein
MFRKGGSVVVAECGLSCNHGLHNELVNVLNYLGYVVATCEEEVVDGREFPRKVRGEEKGVEIMHYGSLTYLPVTLRFMTRSLS